MATLNFDSTQVDPNRPLELLPPGKYPVQIVQSEQRATKTGNGSYIWIEMEILDGPAKGRKLWDRLNLDNKNPQAVDIAQRTLSAICHAVNVLHPKDSTELHFRAMVATVKVKPAEGQYDASNEVRGYEPHGSVAPPQQRSEAPHGQQGQQPAQQPAQQPKTSPPWRRG